MNLRYPKPSLLPVALLLLSIAAVSCASRGSTGKRYNDLPLHNAAAKNDAETVRQEIRQGTNINATAWGDRTALLYAAYGGGIDAATALVEAGADPTIPDNKGNTPLIWAVRSGKLELVKVIAGTKRAINAQNQTGTTALHYAAAARRPDMVDVLMAAGANPDVRDTRGRKPADLTRGDPNTDAALNRPATRPFGT